MSLARGVLLVPLSSLLLTPLACSSPNVAKAAIGTGLAVAAAGINRAITHECWSACRPGLVCDPASGVCVEPGSVRRSAHPRSHPLEPVNANSEGREYEVPPLVGADEDAGVDADAATP